MHFDSILAVTDLTALSAHVLERAALLARQHQTRLRLAHLVENTPTVAAETLTQLTQRAHQLSGRHGIAVHTLDHPVSLKDLLTEDAADAATLLVMGALARQGWKQSLFGSTLDRAVHRSLCPLLVVKQGPIRPYARALVAVDLSPRSKPLIEFTRLFAVPAALTLFHAIDSVDEGKPPSVQVPLKAIQSNQFGSRQLARNELIQLVDELAWTETAGQRAPLAFDIGNGDPALSAATHQRAIQADLVVVGKQPHSQRTRWITSSVAQRLAGCAHSDVLITPLT